MIMKKNIFLLLAALCVLAAFMACDNASEIVTEEYIKEKVDASDNNQGGDQGGNQGGEQGGNQGGEQGQDVELVDATPAPGPAPAAYTYSAVDLGLSVKWANKNYGANSAEDVGYYMTYGCLEPDLKQTPGGYSYIYNTKFDAARIKIGIGWKYPTPKELKELRDKCTWKAEQRNGVSGFRVTGPNGNSIFIPCSGYSTYSSYKVNNSTTKYYWQTVDAESAYIADGTSCYSNGYSQYYLKVYENYAYTIYKYYTYYYGSAYTNYGGKYYDYQKYPIRPVYDSSITE